MFKPDQLESFDSANSNMKFDRPTSGKVYNKRESQKKQFLNFCLQLAESGTVKRRRGSK